MIDRRSVLAGGVAALAASGASLSAKATRKPASSPRFPEGFLWGASTAPHQIEGNNTTSDLWYLEHQQPTVFADVTDSMTIAREEVFGPVMAVLDFEAEDEVIARANATEFGLAAGVFTADLTRGHRVIARLEAGTCWINAYNLTPVQMPFGAVKSSGLGRENSRAAIEHCSQVKSVYVGMGPVESPY